MIVSKLSTQLPHHFHIRNTQFVKGGVNGAGGGRGLAAGHWVELSSEGEVEGDIVFMTTDYTIEVQFEFSEVEISRC